MVANSNVYLPLYMTRFGAGFRFNPPKQSSKRHNSRRCQIRCRRFETTRGGLEHLRLEFRFIHLSRPAYRKSSANGSHRTELRSILLIPTCLGDDELQVSKKRLTSDGIRGTRGRSTLVAKGLDRFVYREAPSTYGSRAPMIGLPLVFVTH